MINNDKDVSSIEATKPKRVKFTNDKVNELFTMFAKDPDIGKVGGFYGQSPIPCKVSAFKNFNEQKVKDVKFNCYACVDAGHVYDDWGKDKAKSEEERLAIAMDKVHKMIKKMKILIQSSNDPLFNSLVIDVVNSDFNICRTHADYSDDGDDHYGVEVFIKIHFI